MILGFLFVKHLRISSEIVVAIITSISSITSVAIVIKVDFFSNRHSLNVSNVFTCNSNVV